MITHILLERGSPAEGIEWDNIKSLMLFIGLGGLCGEAIENMHNTAMIQTAMMHTLISPLTVSLAQQQCCVKVTLKTIRPLQYMWEDSFTYQVSLLAAEKKHIYVLNTDSVSLCNKKPKANDNNRSSIWPLCWLWLQKIQVCFLRTSRRFIVLKFFQWNSSALQTRKTSSLESELKIHYKGSHSHYVGEVKRFLRHVRKHRVQGLPRGSTTQWLAKGTRKLLSRRFLLGHTDMPHNLGKKR